MLKIIIITDQKNYKLSFKMRCADLRQFTIFYISLTIAQFIFFCTIHHINDFNDFNDFSNKCVDSPMPSE